MKLVVGLGNPGKKYEFTRHNIGFLAIDRMLDRWDCSERNIKQKAIAYQTTISDEQIVIIKPQTFMNLSGQAVAPLFHFFKLQPDDLIVLYDEVEIPPFTIRIKQGGGAAGHNGIKSIDACIGSENTNYFRIRLGVGREGDDLAGYVLSEFSKANFDSLDEVLDRSVDATELLIQGKSKEAMNQFNKK